MSWLSGYSARQKLQPVTVTPATQTFTLTFLASDDCRIVANAPNNDTVFNDADYIYVWGDKDTLQRSLLKFNLATHTFPAGYTLTSAVLTLQYSVGGGDPSARSVDLYRLDGTKKGNTWLETTATWDHCTKTGGVGWTGGHDGATGDRAADTPVNSGALGAAGSKTFSGANLITIVNECIEHDASVLNIQLVDHDETGDTTAIIRFNCSENATAPPSLALTYTYTPTIPSNYKLYATVHKGSPSVQDAIEEKVAAGYWTVNGKNYRYRVPFTVRSLDATDAGYQVDVPVDTKKLMAAGVTKYFAGTTATHASSVEFVMLSGADETTNTCKFCIDTDVDVVMNVNTDRTLYTIRTPLAMAANTVFTFYYYMDYQNATASTNFLRGGPDNGLGQIDSIAGNHITTTAASSHFTAASVGQTIRNLTDGTSTTIQDFIGDHEVHLTSQIFDATEYWDIMGVWDFYREWNVSYANLAAFLAGCWEWEVKKDASAADPTVRTNTTASVMEFNLTGGTASKWTGIRVKSAVYKWHDNFRMRFRYTADPTTLTYVGMEGSSDDACNGAEDASITHVGASPEIRVYHEADAGTPHTWVMGNPTSTPFSFMVELRKDGSNFGRWVFYRDFYNNNPDYWTQTAVAANQFVTSPADDVDYQAYVGAYGKNSCKLDYIKIGQFVANEPIVQFPSITYPENGVIFCEDNHEHFPYDTAFALADLTELYWWPDPLAEVTRHPGDSMQLVLRTTDLTSPIFMYCGNAAVTEAAPNSYMSDVHTFEGPAHNEGMFDDFATFTIDASNWVVITGTWTGSPADVAEPVHRRGDSGSTPLGGSGNLSWMRNCTRVKWDTGQYLNFYQGCRWEFAGAYWPQGYTCEWSLASSPTALSGPGKVAFTEPLYPWAWVHAARVVEAADSVGNEKKVYVLYNVMSAAGVWGFNIATCSDPIAADGSLNTAATWTINPNGPFYPPTTASGLGWTMVKRGTAANPIWYVFYEDAIGLSAYCIHCHDADPDDWPVIGSWTDDGEVIRDIVHFEDFDCVYDGTLWYFWGGPSGLEHYWTISDANFPGDFGVTNWTGRIPPPTDGIDTVIAVGPWATGLKTSARVMLDDGVWYMYYSGQNPADAGSFLGRWKPNWVGVSTENDLAHNNWAVANTVKKAYVSNTTGQNYVYKVWTAPTDFEIMAETMLKPAGGERQIGFLFNYSETALNGYCAFWDYVAGVPTVQCWKIVNNVLSAQIGSTYTIPIFIGPRPYPGYPVRLAVKKYGQNIRVGYSTWGNEFVWPDALSIQNPLYRGTRIGLMSNIAAGWWDRLRVRAITSSTDTTIITEPYLGSGQWAYASKGMPSNF